MNDQRNINIINKKKGKKKVTKRKGNQTPHEYRKENNGCRKLMLFKPLTAT